MSDLQKLKLYYFAPFMGKNTIGRGEAVRLLLEDAGIEYEYIRYTQDQWKEEKQKLLAQKIRSPTMPFIVTADGKRYSNTLPLIRFISHKLGKYEGDNEDEMQLVDTYADMVTDWLLKWALVTFLKHTDEDTATYKEKTAPETVKIWDEILSDSKGPFLLGEKISYADIYLYHQIEDDDHIEIKAETYPHVAAFVKAFEDRPNIKRYIATDRA